MAELVRAQYDEQCETEDYSLQQRVVVSYRRFIYYSHDRRKKRADYRGRFRHLDGKRRARKRRSYGRNDEQRNMQHYARG